MAISGYLGIDAGTQGLSVVFVDESMEVLATGEGAYDMLPDLPEGCFEQAPGSWLSALQAAITELKERLSGELHVHCIGLSGQMHGEVLCDDSGNPLAPARLWCDARNEEEGSLLTEKLGVKMPKRITAARWLWTQRNRPDIAPQVKHITTPSGWLAYQLTGEWLLGIGDASGMFPIDQQALDYDDRLLAIYDQLAHAEIGKAGAMRSLLPEVRRAGQPGGVLTDQAAALLGLPAGTPVAPAEGDQPAALAGSLIGDAGMVSVSFGTSVCANSVGDRAFQGVSAVVDHFCAADGKPINMVFLRNGTTFMNEVVRMFRDTDEDNPFQRIMPSVASAPADCGGLLAIPFMDDEPGLGVSRGGTASLVGLNGGNATASNAVRAALLATVFNLRKGSEVLDKQGYPRREIVLTGGLTRTPELAQVVADGMRTPVSLLSSASEGTAWGAALMAKFRKRCAENSNATTNDWGEFLNQHRGQTQRFSVDADDSAILDGVYERYLRLLKGHPLLEQAAHP